MEERLIQEIAYELYKQDWIDTHTNETTRLESMQTYYEEFLKEESDYESYEEWLFERGFDGMIYACFDEFIECEFQDEEYMKHLLGEELYQWLIVEKDYDVLQRTE